MLLAAACMDCVYDTVGLSHLHTFKTNKGVCQEEALPELYFPALVYLPTCVL